MLEGCMKRVLRVYEGVLEGCTKRSYNKGAACWKCLYRQHGGVNKFLKEVFQWPSSKELVVLEHSPKVIATHCAKHMVRA